MILRPFGSPPDGGGLFAYSDTLASRGRPLGTLPLSVGLSLLLGAWGAPIVECRRGQVFLYPLRMGLDSCTSLSIKRLRTTFWQIGRSDKSVFVTRIVKSKYNFHAPNFLKRRLLFHVWIFSCLNIALFLFFCFFWGGGRWGLFLFFFRINSNNPFQN